MRGFFQKKFKSINPEILHKEKERLGHLLRYWESMKKASSVDTPHFEAEIRRIKEKIKSIDLQIAK